MKYVSVACAVLALVTACSKPGGGPGTGAPSGRHAWTQAGILRIAVDSEPKSLNPLLASNTAEGFIDRFMFEPLVSADVHGKPVPMLVATVPSTSNGGISADGLTVTYHLRRGMTWTDGVAVSSADVKYSWHAIADSNDNVISRHGYDIVDRIDTPDALTAVVHLKHRFAPFVNTFFAESDQPYAIVPAHVLAKFPNINQIPFNREPIVSDGPFRFVRWMKGDHIALAANPAFFYGHPQLDRVQISFVPDENTAVNLLRTHEIDYIFQPSIATYPSLSTIRDAHVVFVDMNGFEALEFNVTHPIVSDPLVRRAIAYAVDKAALASLLTHGQEKVATEDIPSWMWAFDASVKSYPYDLAVAHQLMRQAGFTFGTDGTARKNGSPAELLLSTDTANATHRSESVLLQAALKRVGIGVEIKYYPQDVLYATQAMGGILQQGKFDLTLAPWYAGIDPDDSSQFTCEAVAPNGYNTARYCNPEMQAAQTTALTQYDQSVRAKAYGDVQRLLARDNPYIFFWWQRQLEAVSDDFKGFAPNPAVESWNAWQWSI
jgi:peptide/nickel transport system substrate-binding protein